ncbi:12859_t:CDS:1, partial [Dentiscutata heterogama]
LDIKNNFFYASLHTKPVISENTEVQVQHNKGQNNKEQGSLLSLQHKLPLHDITNSTSIDTSTTDIITD